MTTYMQKDSQADRRRRGGREGREELLGKAVSTLEGNDPEDGHRQTGTGGRHPSMPCCVRKRCLLIILALSIWLACQNPTLRSPASGCMTSLPHPSVHTETITGLPTGRWLSCR